MFRSSTARRVPGLEISGPTCGTRGRLRPMSYVIDHWAFDPFVILVAVIVLAEELGLARLRRRSSVERSRRRRINSIFFYVGLLALIIAVDSPVDYWSSRYFFVHMVEHLLIAFLAPVLLVAGAPWVPLAFALPVRTRRRVGRFLLLGPLSQQLRALGRFIRNPWVAVLSFNAVMLIWHAPALFDLSENNQLAHVWLMHGSFMITGVLFWLQIIPSFPMRPSRGPVFQAGAIIATNVVMFLLAMSLSIFSSTSWYSIYAHQPGIALSPFADQQIGAAVLWICGDFWAVPALVIVFRRAMDQGDSVSGTIDRLSGRTSTMSAEEFREARRQRLACAPEAESASSPNTSVLGDT